MLKTWITAACIAGIGFAVPAGVSAQSKASAEPASVRRPFRGIFGAPASEDSPQSLTLTGSLFGAYDGNVLAALSSRPVRDPFLQKSGPYAGSDAGFNYLVQKTGDRLSFGVASAAQMRYTRRSSDRSTTGNAFADLHADWKMTASTTLQIRETASYSPRYNFSLTPLEGEDVGHDIAILDDPAFDLFDLRAARSSSTAFVSQQIQKDTSVSVGYIFRTLQLFDNGAQQNSPFHSYQTNAGSFQINHAHHITRYAELQLGYDLRVSDRHSQTGEPSVMHRINAGVNYSRPLSFSRRTTVSFSSGSAIIPPRRRPDGTMDDQTRYRLTGNASIVHELGRTWTAQLSYNRGVRAHDGFGELYYIDAVYANVDGLFTRRLSWTSTARWSLSALDGSGSGVGRNGHHGESATAQATFALNSVFGIYARYIYYSYRFGDGVRLDSRLPPALDRQGVRIGLTTSVPLIR